MINYWKNFYKEKTKMFLMHLYNSVSQAFAVLLPVKDITFLALQGTIFILMSYESSRTQIESVNEIEARVVYDISSIIMLAVFQKI